MRTILVYTHPFNFTSGGIVVLHKLCHLLRQKDQNARLWMVDDDWTTWATWPEYDTPIANGKVDPRDCVVIYPEIVSGNILEAKHAVWWLLNKPGFWGGTFEAKPEDLIVTYSDHFSADYPNAEQLRVIECWFEYFSPDPTIVRKGGCYAMRKGAIMGKQPIPETDGLKPIVDSSYDIAFLRNTFRESEVFYSYDSATFLSLHAALCGCTSIVIPDEGMTKDQWLNKFPLMKYGVAYGLEDRAWSETTKDKVRDHLMEEEAKCLLTVDNLIERINNLT
jgi:hypothetical protein